MSTAVIDAAALLLSQAVNVKCSLVAAAVLLCYDTSINLSDEVNLIWLQRWTVGKVLYIVTRYLCFFDVILIIWYSFHVGLTVEACRTLYETEMWLITIGVTICHAVLIIRSYAIWERSALVLAYLCLVQVASFIVEVVQLEQSLKFVTFIPSPVSTIVPCIPVLGNNRMLVVFCIIVGLELNFLCLLLYKGLSQWCRNSTPLIHTLYRDGFIYFTVLLSISLVNTIMILKFFNSPYYSFAIVLQRVLHSILASRLIINVRGVVALNELSLRYSATSFYNNNLAKPVEEDTRNGVC